MKKILDNGLGKEELQEYALRNFREAADEIRYAGRSDDIIAKHLSTTWALKHALASRNYHYLYTAPITGGKPVEGSIPREVNNLVSDAANLFYLVHIEKKIYNGRSIDESVLEAFYDVDDIVKKLQKGAYMPQKVIVDDSSTSWIPDRTIIIMPAFKRFENSPRELLKKKQEDVVSRWA